ncbi:lipoprotein-releasing ABC transporter ATP-binding protein LolD [Gayadomonas joobiniege]|uniref:lipoprotein-releasing ABC transporter ATP-binding protein LolD n=1 Tax=Gayadomonas joobiniege TaxID=1234606 RepID=UPI00035D0404|nr:lipoprotein-releasing ABC transporter ATP-binding protein LolD [Gayadomonas joobiniege]
MNKIILDGQQISKSYQDGDRQVAVLKQVDLQIHEAEHLAIVGSSGSGKSTLLHILGALDKPSGGKVIFDGTDIHQLSSRKQAEFRNHHLGFVYQFHHLLSDFDALENTAMPLLIDGMKKSLALEKARAMLTKVGLDKRLDHLPSALSGGERQRVAIARALVHQPKLVLADEPTGNLDADNAQAIFELISELRTSLATSFVFVTHDLALAERMDRQLVLKKGQLEAADLTGVVHV